MSQRPIDVDALLRPLSDGPDGVGSDLRLDVRVDSLYRQLKDARRAARDEERARDRNADEVTDASAPAAEGWWTVLPLGEEILADHSKDLEVASWMTEALVRLHGLVGLEVGAKLITGLCERFWDHCHPVIDEEGLETRAIPLRSLAGEQHKGTLLQSLRQLDLCKRTDGSSLNYFVWQKMAVAETLKAEQRDALFAAGLPKREGLIAEAQGKTEHKLVTQRWREALAAREAWCAMEVVLDAKFGVESPRTKEMRTLLDGMVDALVQLGARDENAVVPPGPSPNCGNSRLTGSAGGDIVEPATVAAGVVGAALGGIETRDRAFREPVQLGARNNDAVVPPKPSLEGDNTRQTGPAGVDGAKPETVPAGAVSAAFGGIKTRDSAFRELEELADFFRRTEPHSPLASTLDEVVRRGRMSFTELLAEVLPDDDVRTVILGRLGIRVELK